MSSLRTRLFIILVAATSLIWLFAIGWISVRTKHEVENVLDSRLEQAARMVSALVTSNNVASPSDDSDSPHILAVPTTRSSWTVRFGRSTAGSSRGRAARRARA
jgi:two-component system, OmpR family, sensor histidine kinase QseC